MQSPKEKTEKRETPLPSEKGSLKPSLPKNLVSNVYRNPARIKVKDLELTKSNVNTGNLEITTQSANKASSEETNTNNDTDQSNATRFKQIRCVYYANNLKKHWKRYNEKDYFCRLYREHFYQIFQEMKACKAVRPVDQIILNRKSVTLSKRESHKGIFFTFDSCLVD